MFMLLVLDPASYTVSTVRYTPTIELMSTI